MELLENRLYYKGNLFKNYRYITDCFKSNRKQTYGVECFEKKMKVNDKNYLIKFWDTAGQERFAVVSKNYYRVAHGIIITSSIIDRDSFINLKKWFYSIKDNNTYDNLQIILVGSKCDLEEERKVQKSEFEKVANELKVKFFETSAKEGTGINDAFDCIVNLTVYSIYKSKDLLTLDKNRPNTGSFHLKGNEKKDKTEPKKCCR